MIWIALIFAGLFETAVVTMIHYWNTYKKLAVHDRTGY